MTDSAPPRFGSVRAETNCESVSEAAQSQAPSRAALEARVAALREDEVFFFSCLLVPPGGVGGHRKLAP